MNKILCYLLLILTACEKSITIKTKPSKYKIVKADFQKEKCELQNVNFHEKKDEVVILKEDFTILANNINNLKICYNHLFEKANTSIKYYEEVISTLGGNFDK